MDLLWEIISMSTCMLGLGYGLHYYAFKNGIADERDKVDASALKKRAKANKEKVKTGNSFLDKWLDFGGGYYGCIAMIKLIFIGLGQVGQFISDWQGLDNFINDIGIGMLVNFFVEQFMNFMAAVTWPINYLNQYSIFQCGLFVAVTYFAYEVSRRMAREKLNRA